MDCLKYEELINKYFDNELSEEEKRELFSHLEACDSCENTFDDLSKIREFLKEPMVELPSDFKEKLHDKLVKETKVKKISKRNTFIKIGSIAAVVLVAIGIWNPLSNKMNMKSEGALDSDTMLKEEAVAGEKSLNNEGGFSDKLLTIKNIEATETTEYGTAVSSAFKIELAEEMTMDDIKKNIIIDPNIKYDIEKVNETVYMINPSEILAKNKVYAIKVFDYSKAFQTEEDLKLSYRYPNNKSESVPSNSFIKMVFNREVQDIKEQFDISPKVSGRFEYDKNIVRFIPDNLLDNTKYTITLKEGITSGEKQSTEEYKWSFETEYEYSDQRKEYFIKTIQPGKESFIPLGYTRRDTRAKINLYQVEDFNQFKKAKLEFEASHRDINMDSFDMVYENEDGIREYNNGSYMSIPALDKGMYIARIAAPDKIVYVFINVDDCIYYFAETEDDYIIWVIDNKIKKPVEGAELFVKGKSLGRSDKKGSLVVKKSSSTNDIYIKVEDSNYLVKALVNSYDRFMDYYSRNYWTFMYTDRTVYMPTDTINVFGFAKKYIDKKAGKFRLVISDYSDKERFAKDIYLDENLTFTESFNIKDFDQGYYFMTLYDDQNKVVSITEVNVKEYEKPEIRLDSELNKKVLFIEDSLIYKVKSSYFNGMPYKNLNFKLYGHAEDALEGTTDDNGEYILNYKAEANSRINSDHWRPRQVYLDLTAYTPEKTYLNKNDYIHILPRDIMIEIDTDEKDGMVTASIETNKIKLNGDEKFISYDYSNIKGDSIDVDYEVQIEDRYYVKTSSYNTLDLVNNVRKEHVTYKQEVDLLNPITGKTVDGKGSFTFESKKGHTYNIKVIAYDTKDRRTMEDIYYSTSRFNVDFEYDLKFNKEEFRESNYKLGEEVHYDILRYGESIQDTEEDYTLELKLRNGLLEYDVLDKASHSFEFKKEYRPNVLLKVMYYDGYGIHMLPVYGHRIVGYDHEELKYNIKVVANQSDYRPSEKAVIDIEVFKDNKPFNGKVNVSVVDEAYFSIYEDYFNIIDLHSFVYNSGMLVENTSSDGDKAESAAEGGEGGGGDFIRDNFKDTALFKTIDVNDGKASIELDLPDNLTSWRMTLNAVNKNLEYGSNKSNVNVNLPFFIRNISDTKYVKGDDIYLTLRSDGKDLIGDVTYGLDAFNKKETVLAEVGKTVFMKIGSKDKDFEYIITGSNKNQKDGIKDKIVIKDSFVELNYTIDGKLSTEYKVKYPERKTVLNLYNNSFLEYVNRLRNILSWNPMRSELIIANNEVFKIVNTIYNEAFYDNQNVSNLQGENGGIYSLEHDTEESVETTSLVLASGYTEDFDVSGMIAFLKEKIADNNLSLKEGAMAVWALSAYDEPVLLAVDNMIKREDLDSNVKLYLLMAMDNLKDVNRAIEYYNEVYADKNSLGDVEKFLLGMMSHKLKMNQSDYGLDFLDQTMKNSLGIEKLLYLEALNTDISPSKVDYTIDGKEYSLSIEGNKVETIELDNNEFKVLSVEGDVLVYEVMNLKGTDYKEYQNSDIKLQKIADKTATYANPYKVIYKYTKEKRRSAFVSIKIPSGFEFLHAKESNDYYIREDGKDVSIYLYGSGRKEDTMVEEKEFVIELMPVQKGTYTFESDYMKSWYNNRLYMTDPIKITVSE